MSFDLIDSDGSSQSNQGSLAALMMHAVENAAPEWTAVGMP
jgi:hypothetical protein